MSKASLELGGGNWGTKDGNLLAYAQGNESSNLVPREFTFTRGSDIAATRINSSGLIEKYRENLLEQSNQFDTTWVTYDATPTSGENGYDGSSDAWKLSSNSAGTNRRISQAKSINGIVTFSVYAKAGTYNGRLYLRVGGDQNYRAFFDLSNGTTDGGTNLITSESVSVGNGWYRYIAVWNIGTGSTPEIRFGDATITDDYFYIQDAQLEQGLVATSYLESGATTATSGVADNEPRIDYAGGTASLLLEPSRTNLVPISEGVPEDINAVTLTENYGTSPEGLQNSLKVQKDGVSSNDRILPIDNYNATLVSGTSYFVSAFVKNIDVDNGGLTTIGCRISGGSLFRLAYEWTGSSLAKNTTTGSSTGTRVNEICEDYGNGWWRIGFGFEADGTTSNIEIDVDRQNSSATTSIETYGWQLEEGSYATSYIPTYGTSVTRSEDTTAELTLSPSYGSSNTWFFELKRITDTSLSNQSISILKNDSTGANNRFTIFSTSNGRFRVLLSDGSGTTENLYSPNDSFEQGETIKAAVKITPSGCTLFVDGSSVATSSSVGTITGIDAITYFRKAALKQFSIFSTALTDRELVDLTSPYSTYQELVTAEGLTWESPTCTTNSITELQSI